MNESTRGHPRALLDPRQLAALVDQATRQAVSERLGVVEEPATMAEILAQGESLAAPHIENYSEVRQSIMDELVERPAWLEEVRSNPSPAVLAKTFVNVASVLAAAETARSQTASMRREAQTMSGASARPGTQSDDEQAWARIKAAGSGGYAGP
jgi:hypothetical protein